MEIPNNNININEKIYKTIFWSLIILGIGLRIQQFLTFRSFWLDEVLIATNIINKSYSELSKSLDNCQSAPYLWLIIQKFITSLFDYRDYSFRIYPLITGIAVIPVFIKLSNKYFLSRIGKLLALALVTLSFQLIYYSSEAKPYGSDVLISLLILLAFERALEGRKYLYINWASMCIIAPWFSQNSIFLISSTGIALFINTITKKDYKNIIHIIFAGALVISNFLFAFFFIYINQSYDSMVAFWQNNFAPIPTIENISWYFKKYRDTMQIVAGFTLTSIIAWLVIPVGMYRISRQNIIRSLSVLLTPLVILTASLLNKYPFHPRLVLFFMPVLVLWTCAGFSYIEERICIAYSSVKFKKYLFVGLLLVFIFNSNLYKAVNNLIEPFRKEDIKPVLEYINTNIKGNDQLYVAHTTITMIQYYKKYYPNINDKRIIYGMYPYKNDPYLNKKSSIKGRVWVIFSHHRIEQYEYITASFDKIGEKIDEYKHIVIKNENVKKISLNTLVLLYRI